VTLTVRERALRLHHEDVRVRRSSEALAEVEERLGDWRQHAACRDLDTAIFYPGRGEDTTAAKAICAGCPARAECLDYALANREVDGIWGGLSGRERRGLRRETTR
jgi:hypothetical protein